ncbi:MAG: HAD family hydrolase [Candidatus Pristimantibacillus lignocellulolyticus]|uniref:HAD family hydrolase n=1 Tax=Candidatus Pristimantibacillus lignocellulolyticus TaxID=2994561 RepID=A0A9J6ZFJ9_9BACL|nr:MAG: HAD family hydrolase [Candidatus Pristimantibacillus lignocellulolyticus]
MTKAIFFDVDDTLYDHLIPFQKAVKPYVSHIESFPYEEAYHRMRYYSDKISAELGGAGQMEQGSATEAMKRDRFQFALNDFDIAIDAIQAQRIQQTYFECQFDIELFPDACELIIELQQSGFIVGVLTNGAEAHQWRKIKALKIDQLIPIERIFVSGSYGWDKPDTKIFHYINEQTGTLPEQCTYVGDSWRNDVIGATSAGWNMIWFNHRKVERESNITLHGEVDSFEKLRYSIL